MIINALESDGVSQCWRHSHIISFDFYNPNKINGAVLLLFLFGRCRNRVPQEVKDLAEVTELERAGP